MFEKSPRSLKIVLLVLVVSLLATLVLTQRGMIGKKTTTTVAPATIGQPQPETTPSAVSTEEPQKSDFGTNMPADFPTDIPVEEGVKVEQSYSLNYAGQKQLTIVFPSTKTVKENYALYADFLKKQNWNVSNKYESPSVSSLYAAKENNDINVTISESATTPSVKSQVSISVLKK